MGFQNALCVAVLQALLEKGLRVPKATAEISEVRRDFGLVCYQNPKCVIFSEAGSPRFLDFESFHQSDVIKKCQPSWT